MLFNESQNFTESEVISSYLDHVSQWLKNQDTVFFQKNWKLRKRLQDF